VRCWTLRASRGRKRHRRTRDPSLDRLLLGALAVENLVTKKRKQLSINLNTIRINCRTDRVPSIQHIDEVRGKDTMLRIVIFPGQLIRARGADEEPCLVAIKRLEELHSGDDRFRIAAVEDERRSFCLHR
jgi:hypothetical protein